MRPPLIAGNWKMNGLLKEARDLATGLRKELGDNAGGPEVLVCPSFLALGAVREALEGSPIRLGAQDVHWEAKGAFTGEISLGMLQDVGCSAVLLGHMGLIAARRAWPQRRVIGSADVSVWGTRHQKLGSDMRRSSDGRGGERYGTVITTLPRLCPLSTYLCASTISSRA